MRGLRLLMQLDLTVMGGENPQRLLAQLAFTFGRLHDGRRHLVSSLLVGAKKAPSVGKSGNVLSKNFGNIKKIRRNP